MAKNFLNDIKPLKHDDRPRRSIEAKSLPESDRPINLPPKFSDRGYSSESPKRKNWLIWVVVLIVIVGAGFGISSFFAKANVALTPKSAELNLDKAVFNAVLNGDESVLTFKIAKVTGTADKIITATQKTEAGTKATGKVIIFNSFGTAPQKLDIETRLSTKDGKIFKTDTAVVIPGTKVIDGKIVPGQLEVGVHASEAGDTYNIPLSDFTIVGFKGSPKYDKIYARSKTVMAGGGTGERYTLSEAEAKVAHESAVSSLTEKLVADVRSSLPDDSILLPGAYILRENPSVNSASSTTDQVTVTAEGTLIGILFNKENLVNKLAETNISNYDGEPITIPELNSLTVEISNRELLTETSTAISFSISGRGLAVWEIDQTKMLTELMGVKKQEISRIMAGYSSVKNSEVKVSPFWSFKLPRDPSKIHIKIASPKAE